LITEIDTEWLKEFHAVIAVVYRQEVYFSPVGNISAWITNENELVNIFDYLESGIDAASPDKVFTNILSGNIEANQLLFFTTNTIFNYIENEEVADIAIQNEPAGLILKLKKLLYSVENENFCLVSTALLPVTTDKTKKEVVPKIVIKPSVTPQESMEQLLNTEQATKDILNKGKSRKSEEIEDKIIPVKETAKPKKKKIKKDYLKIIKTKLQPIWDKISQLLAIPYRKIKNLLAKSTEKNKASSQKALNAVNKRIDGFRKNNKAIIIAIVLIFITLGTSIYFTKQQKKKQVKNENYNNIVNNIEEKSSEYDLLLIYNDENSAKQKLAEISELINKLPQETPEQQAKYKEILDNFTEIFNQANKLNTVQDLKQVAKLNFIPNKISKHQNTIIATGDKSTQLAKLNLNNQEVTNISLENTNYQNISEFEKDDKFLYGLNSEDKVVKINLDNNNSATLDIAYHPNYKQADDLALYNGRVYILDSSNNQIYRHNQGSINFSKGEEWLKDDSNIANATSIVIDSSIYVGTRTGKIQRLYGGKAADFELETIDPEIKNIDQLYTDQSINEIYILESKSKRIIVVNKEGKLLNQYYLPTLNTIDDFIIDGAAQKIYIQSGNKIVEFQIPTTTE
jgi:hypothetical protein